MRRSVVVERQKQDQKMQLFNTTITESQSAGTMGTSEANRYDGTNCSGDAVGEQERSRIANASTSAAKKGTLAISSAVSKVTSGVDDGRILARYISHPEFWLVGIIVMTEKGTNPSNNHLLEHGTVSARCTL